MWGECSLLKDLIRSRNKEGLVIPLIEQQVLIEGKRDAMARKQGVFHPSEITYDFCPREWLYRDRDRTMVLRRKVDANTQLKFGVGHALHKMVQDLLGNAGVLFGYWSCERNCLSEKCVQFGFKPSQECSLSPNKEAKAKWKFDELPVIDEELNISGSTDGLLITKGSKYVFEFKTIYENGFSTLVEPLKHHKEQALWYLDVLERNNDVLENMLSKMEMQGVDVSEQLKVVRMPFSGVVSLYMNKNDQSLREFLTRGNAPPTREFLIEMGSEERDELEKKKEILRQTLVHREEGTLPERHEKCTDKMAYRARRCVARIECFREE